MENKPTYEQTLLIEADRAHISGRLEEAVEKYAELMAHAEIAPYCYYRVAEILNKKHDPLTAKDFYYRAFSMKPDLAKDILAKEHQNHNYVFSGQKPEITQEKCPLCGETNAEAYWCYSVIEIDADVLQKCNPVRVWMHCGNCHHLYAEQFSKIQDEEDSYQEPHIYDDNFARWRTADKRLARYSEIISHLMRLAGGVEFLEIGIGGCEGSLVAREMGLNVFGVEISNQAATDARNLYGLTVERCDFVKFETDKKWDIMMMGDVLEHVFDPVCAIKKAHELLNDNGVIWISTPNFESAYTKVVGHYDPMRKEVGHVNYFSRISLCNLLQKCNFRPIDYQISHYYRGSMEIVAIKDDYYKKIEDKICVGLRL